MQTNALYNLLCQLVQEQKSLWRINNHYLAECANDSEKTFWEAMIKDKEKHIKDLMKLAKPHFS